mmetsp:Transcript_33849/g.74035  ORF Transcript_33849/g.74035 Transcript_33849/m.74035 type:complete len:242 (-) Transcript_33849:126-851(-)
MASYTAGMRNCVTPPPRLPQPPAVALAIPTILGLNITEDQNWQATKVARPQPMKKREMRNPMGVVTVAIPKTAGATPSIRNAYPQRGPNVSQKTPIDTRQKMVPVTAATPALPMSMMSMSISLRMTGIIGAAAKVDTNVVKKPSQLQWKASMWGRAKLTMANTVDLCSASTGRANWSSCLPSLVKPAPDCTGSLEVTPLIDAPGSSASPTFLPMPPSQVFAMFSCCSRGGLQGNELLQQCG